MTRGYMKGNGKEEYEKTRIVAEKFAKDRRMRDETRVKQRKGLP